MGKLRCGKDLGCSNKKKIGIKGTIFALEDERTGDLVNFNLYTDKELTFLDPTKKKN